MNRYVAALKREIEKKSEPSRICETVYFGGGTPNIIGAKRLAEILSAVKNSFNVSENAEITIELNPHSVDEDFFKEIYKAGFNRISIGLQSANEDELKLLGRKHSADDVSGAVKLARKAGFNNISLDLMIALPNQSKEKLKKSIDFAKSLDIEHISSYILKVEKGTPFHRQRVSDLLPDDDTSAELYLFCVEELKNQGYAQYEISNFSKTGYESKHNLIYWRCEEYLGFGPSAYSFYNKKRYHYSADIEEYILRADEIDDGEGGDFEEFVMLALRLKEGLQKVRCERRFTDGAKLFDEVKRSARLLPQNLIEVSDEKIALTAEGFAVSNAIISKLLYP